jgi:hypothetical protein
MSDYSMIVLHFINIRYHIYNTKRQANQHDYLPDCWALETKELKKCTTRKKIFSTGPTRAAKAEQNISWTVPKCTKDAENVYAPLMMVSIGARTRTPVG